MKNKRLISFLTAFLLLASAANAFPASASAPDAPAAAVSDDSSDPSGEEAQPPEQSDIAAEGTIGETITWQLDNAGTLTVTGSGEMTGGGLFGANAGNIKKAVIQNTDSKNTITAIGGSVFRGCVSLTEVILPDTVTAIGDQAFSGCTSLETVTFPEKLASIGSSAFSGCAALTELTLPGCQLGKAAFKDCTALKAVTVGEGAESVPPQCFRGCTALESVALPDSLKSIECGYYGDEGAFNGCTALKTVSIGSGIETIDSRAFATGGEALEVTFREGAAAVPAEAFTNRTELTKVSLPETLKTIGKQAFGGCTNLAVCNFPEALTEIGSSAFNGTVLPALTLPGCQLDKAAFKDCTALKTVTIAEGAESIPAQCFRGCTALESVTLPDSLKSIECGYYGDEGAFNGCTALKTVSIGSGIETIDSRAFATGGEVLEVTFREGAAAVPAEAFTNRTELTKVSLPETLKTIGKQAFGGCSNLAECSFPEALTEIGSSAFSGTALPALTLPGCQLDKAAFKDCTALKTVTIAEGAESIPAQCFRGCTALESVTLPDSVKSIECGYYGDEGAFNGCTALKTVSIGSGIETIDTRAFATGGEALEVTFREGVTAVPENAFNNRTEITKVSLPETLKTIGKQAFCGCSDLAECSFPEALTEIGSSAFNGTALPALTLPGCQLGDAAFADCKALKTVTVNEGAESLPSQCFRGCTALESVMLPDSLKSIECGYYGDQGAFQGCTALNAVSLGKSIETIDRRAFYTGSEDLEVTFREGVTVIPSHAFDGTDVSAVVLPVTLSELRADDLAGCSNLDRIDIQSPDCVIADSENALPEGTIIRAAEDSTAAAYAEQNGRTFVTLKDRPEGICDLNGDGKYTAEDAILLLRILSEDAAALEEANAEALASADRNNDALLTLKDVRLMLKEIQAEV